MKNFYQILDQIPVTYIKHEHPAVFTYNEADALCGDIPGIKSKNLFLRNRKGNIHYLLVVRADKKTDLKALAKTLGEVQVGFASEERLLKHLGLTPGSVSPFGLINDEQHEVIVLVDNDVMESEIVSFHPNINTATLELSQGDFRKFLETMGNEVRSVTV